MAAAADVWGQRGKILRPGLSREKAFGASVLLTHLCPSLPRGFKATGSGLEGTRPQKSWFMVLLGFRPAPSSLSQGLLFLTLQGKGGYRLLPPPLREGTSENFPDPRPCRPGLELGPLCSSLKPGSSFLVPRPQAILQHQAHSWTPVPSTQLPAFSSFYLSQIAFWPLILIPVNMIHEGPGLGSLAGLLESPIKEPSIIYENYRGALAGEGWAASRWRAVCQCWPPSVPGGIATGGFAAGGRSLELHPAVICKKARAA